MLGLLVAIGLDLLVGVELVSLLLVLKPEWVYPLAPPRQTSDVLDGDPLPMAFLFYGMDPAPRAEEVCGIVDDRPLPMVLLFYGYAALALSIGYTLKISLKTPGGILFWGLWGLALLISTIMTLVVLLEPRLSTLRMPRIRQWLHSAVVSIAFVLTIFGLWLNMITTLLPSLDPKGLAMFYIGSALFVLILVQMLKGAVPGFRGVLLKVIYLVFTGLGIYRLTCSHNKYEGFVYLLFIPVVLLFSALPGLLHPLWPRVEQFCSRQKKH